jgi:polysaccharide export outer membrane protein
MNFRIFHLLGLVLVLASCTRDLTYFNKTDIEPVELEHKEVIANSVTPKIQPNDLLSIRVSSISPEANTLFNQGVIPSASGISGSGSNNQTMEGYLVDSAGYIQFPVLGRVKLAGLSREGAISMLTDSLQEYLREPVVNIKYLNYRITVIGEVRNPSTFTVPSEKVNILTALGMAGDLTPFGKRENVLIIREEQGVRTMTRMNLNSRDVLNSPYFYLQQNDVIYVEPVKTRGYQASGLRANIPFVLSIVSALTILTLRLSR